MTNHLEEVEKMGEDQTKDLDATTNTNRISVSVNGENAPSEEAPTQLTERAGEKEVDVPPNGGYGWVCVACILTINAYVRLYPSVREGPSPHVSGEERWRSGKC